MTCADTCSLSGSRRRARRRPPRKCSSASIAEPARSTARRRACTKPGRDRNGVRRTLARIAPETSGFASALVINPIRAVRPTWSAIPDRVKLRIHLWTSGFFDDIRVLSWLNVQEFSQPMTTPHPAPRPGASVRRNAPPELGAVGGCVRRHVLSIVQHFTRRALGSDPQKFSTAAWLTTSGCSLVYPMHRAFD